MELQMALMFRMLVLVMMCSVNAFARASNVVNSSCPGECGNTVNIPYPFGIGNGCYVGDWFEIVCKNDSYDYLGFSKVPFLKRFDLEVLKINIAARTVLVNYSMFSSCTGGRDNKKNQKLEKSPFVFSDYNNSFVAMGCNNSASMWSFPDESISYGGCKSRCDRAPFTNGSLCNATNCCQTTIPSNIHAFTTTIDPQSSSNGSSTSEYCNYAFFVEKDWFENNFTEPNPNMSVPVLLDWGIDNTSFYSLPIWKNSTAREYKNSTYYCGRSYPTIEINSSSRRNYTFSCRCWSGYRGNPYLLGGCEGNEMVQM